jgi:toxin ParE1/3/4
MSIKIMIEAAAMAELEHARDYYQEKASLKVAENFLSQFSHAVERLREYPEIGTLVSKRLRQLPLRQFPYSLIYHYEAESLTIVAIASQRRRPGYWAKRR